MKKIWEDWARHWPCDTDVIQMEGKPWRTEELTSIEKGAAKVKNKKHLEICKELQGHDWRDL